MRRAGARWKAGRTRVDSGRNEQLIEVGLNPWNYLLGHGGETALFENIASPPRLAFC